MRALHNRTEANRDRYRRYRPVVFLSGTSAECLEKRLIVNLVNHTTPLPPGAKATLLQGRWL